MLSSIILLRCDGPQGSGFPPVEYLYTIGPRESGERGGHLFRLGSVPYTNYRELRLAELRRTPLPRTRAKGPVLRDSSVSSLSVPFLDQGPVGELQLPRPVFEGAQFLD